jgi:biofilm PGA synthesis N-glycosyltransferase PgaC
MKIAIVVMFLNEERHLGVTLESLAGQTRVPDYVVLVDDGSTDGSPAIASAFIDRFPHAELVRRPPRAHEADRLASASVWESFQQAAAPLSTEFDVVAKMDADLDLPPVLIAEIEARFASDARLGLTGPYLSEVDASGGLVRLPGRPEHVAGAVKFWRSECYREVCPLPALLNFDMVDEAKARSLGWRTESFSCPGGDPLHLRRHGSYNGSLRAFRRWGIAEYQSGTHPVSIAYVGLQRMREKPFVVGGLTYYGGWVLAAYRGVPRFDADVRAFRRREQLARLRQRVREVVRSARRRPAPTR